MSVNKKLDSAPEFLDEVTGDKLTFGNMIWSIRKCEGMSQIEFAKLLGISSSHLCDIEHDRKIVSPILAKKYAQILGDSERQFIRLALQAVLDKNGVEFNIQLEPKVRKHAAKHRHHASASIAI